MASEFKKPLGITELWKEDIQQKLWPLQVRFMYGVGRQTAKNSGLGINTIGELALFDRNILIKNLGKGGAELYSHAHGIDNSLVPKSDTI